MKNQQTEKKNYTSPLLLARYLLAEDLIRTSGEKEIDIQWDGDWGSKPLENSIV